MFKLFAEVLRYPRFDLVQFDILKSNLKGQIARRNDNPSNLANREFKKLIYGPYSPFARSEELQTIDNITLQDISDFYRQIGPERIILGLVGDFESNQVKLLIKKTLANWKKKENEPKKIYSENLVQYSSGKIFKVEQNHLNQNTVLIGQLGGKLDSLDYPSLSVLNGVFNGFGGRFFNEIRSRQGLAYNVYGLWKANYNYPGFFVAGGQTRATQTVPFIKAIKKEITRIIENPISADELSYAKDSILNSFVFSFSKPSLILNRLLNYEYFKYPIDFIFDYQKSVKKVNSRDIQRVAREYLHPENMVTLIVGNTNNIQPPLQVLEDQATDIQIN
jgi:zinc protease